MSQVMHAEDMLEGHRASVRILRLPDGGIGVRIGGRSLLGSKEPLDVLDGRPVRPGTGSGLTGIDWRTIERIQILSAARTGRSSSKQDGEGRAEWVQHPTAVQNLGAIHPWNLIPGETT